MQDKVSIITPSWNSEKYIKKTIESVQNQTYSNWEMIVLQIILLRLYRKFQKKIRVYVF